MFSSQQLFHSLCICFTFFSLIAQASVPPSATFKYVNEGEFGEYIVEYDANYRPLKPFARPFQLCFYNTTPNAYTLALRMGTVRSESLMRWVWEANRGNPVGENATFTFGTDGNLVLADADGRIAWQTNTANKGIVGFKLLSNGNMILHDSKGSFIWQSFDHPSDTLLVGQSLKFGAATKLTNRVSEKKNANGPYSLVLEDKTLAMYYRSPNSPKPLLYFSFSKFGVLKAPLRQATFGSGLSLEFHGPNLSSLGTLTFRKPRYNTTLSYLRLEMDGNLRIHTYEDNADWNAWQVTYTLFSRDSSESECYLPERCGNFGLCEDDQCVACPSPKGLVGWSKNCEVTKVSSCGVKDFYYYKLEGVDHFNSKYTNGDGPMKQGTCGSKCSKDCKCLGYFYHTQSSRCWIAYDLKTLTKIDNSTHLAFIKAPNK
ncbi:epidermis-specific secreted glycoprotein EP1 [Manihot esculenta]|uniref:Bulb-type lectin domain-containing protein n=1 Tax=Manihot esculenta TaxID=3983 RepID=A0A2C9UGB0_MANES|nr:epidermis-specific secreted glycoprotein EP1 [Manihot esculenta]OAY28783.1 hypothetical protein MANES_15G094100v8 [Manihot esculenta]